MPIRQLDVIPSLPVTCGPSEGPAFFRLAAVMRRASKPGHAGACPPKSVYAPAPLEKLETASASVL